MSSPNEWRPGDPVDREVNMGGADAVEKTSYTSPHGAEPNLPHPDDAAPNARVTSRGGLGPVAWVLIGLLVLAMIVYGLGRLG